MMSQQQLISPLYLENQLEYFQRMQEVKIWRKKIRTSLSSFFFSIFLCSSCRFFIDPILFTLFGFFMFFIPSAFLYFCSILLFFLLGFDFSIPSIKDCLWLQTRFITRRAKNKTWFFRSTWILFINIFNILFKFSLKFVHWEVTFTEFTRNNSEWTMNSDYFFFWNVCLKI